MTYLDTIDMNRYLAALPQFLVILPSAISCYYVMKNQMERSLFRISILCTVVLVPYSLLASWLCVVLKLEANVLLLSSLVPFFFLYRRTVTADFPKCLAVYVGVCAVQSIPSQFAYAFDAYRHPSLGAADFSVEAGLFHLVLSCLVAAAFAWPACCHFFRMVDRLDSPKIWYLAVALSSMFLLFNITAVPKSYSTLHTGRMFFLFLLVEGGMLVILTIIYLLFYWGTNVILERAELRERSQLLEIQTHQYRTLQEHMRQTARLRHDFRHSVHLLSFLAQEGNLDSIRTHLARYETSLAENAPANYCANAALNALFSYYHEMAASAGIDMDWHIELPDLSPVNEIDIVSLFGNLMENAIDGCLTIQEGRRYFYLTTKIHYNNHLYIVSTNNFDGKIRKVKGNYRSTKHNGNGIGLAAISATAEKYGGSAQASNTETEFFVDVVLKI